MNAKLGIVAVAGIISASAVFSGGFIVNPVNEIGDFVAPAGANGFAWDKLSWDSRCAIEVMRVKDTPDGIDAFAAKNPDGRVYIYAFCTNTAAERVNFTVSLANGGTLRGAKAFTVNTSDDSFAEIAATYDNYGAIVASLGPGNGLFIDADPYAQMPFADISNEVERQFVIAEGTNTFYNGHPTMTACENQDHLIAVWSRDHAGPCGPAAESVDGGRTWIRIDERFPEKWHKTVNCPSIYRLRGPDGKDRLWVWSNSDAERNLDMMMPSVMSEDNGQTWKLMPPLGPKFHCVMGFTSVAALPDGTHFAAFHRSRNAVDSGWQDTPPHEVAGTFSNDGGFTWSDPFVIASDPNGRDWYCEPCVFLSPDGKELCCLMREQHRGLSHMCFSTDFGKTWSRPEPTSRALSGHRHTAIVLPDGLVAVAMRTWYQPLENPSRDPYFGCWIGPYSSIRAGKDTDSLMVKLLDSKPSSGSGAWDTGYPAFALNGSRELVAATYTHYRADANQHSIAGVRFDPRELIARTRFPYQKPGAEILVSTIRAKPLTSRKGIGNFVKKCVPGATVKVGYFGGSITEGNGWRPMTFEWLRKHYPETEFVQVDAALGGTGSAYGAYRLAKDIIPKSPDLVFIEFSLNDGPGDQRRNVEGYVRNYFRAKPDGEIIFVYTVGSVTSKLLEGGYLTSGAATFERVADHYGIPSMAMGIDAAELAKQGRLIWNAGDDRLRALAGTETEKDRPEDQGRGPIVFLQDGAHPYRETGHRLYADVVERGLEALLGMNEPGVDRKELPVKLFVDCLGPVNYYSCEESSAAGVVHRGDWHFDEKIQTSWWRDPPSFYKFYRTAYRSESADAEITFKFKGASVLMAFLRGPLTGIAEITVDDVSREVPLFDMYSAFWRLDPYMLCSDLDPEKVHTVRIRSLLEVDRKSILEKANRGETYQKYRAEFDDPTITLGYLGLFVEGELVK